MCTLDTSNGIIYSYKILSTNGLLGRAMQDVSRKGVLHKAGFPPCDGTHALTTWLLLKNLDKASLELAMNCWT